MALLAGIIPLIVFVLVDSFAGLKAGLITAVVFALLEVVFTLIYFGELDYVTAVSVLLVLGFAGVSYKKKSDHWFKMQPVVLSILFAAILLVSSLIGRPFLYEMALKYQEVFPQLKMQLAHPLGHIFYQRSNLFLGFGFLAHAGATYFAAKKLSNWWWIAARGVGFYLVMGICTLLVNLSLMLSR